MFYVYILKSIKDARLYIGYTNNLRRRLKEHQLGQVEATRHRALFKLLYYEAYISQKDAARREQNLKTFGRALGGLKRRIQESLKS